MNLCPGDERGDAALCSALMGTAWLWWGTGCLQSVLWAALVWRDTLMWTWWGSLALCLLHTWLTMRCLLDARLFQHMAQARWSDGPALDASLRRVLGVQRPPSPGATPAADMAQRIAGGLRLYRSGVALAVVHAAALGLLWGWFCAFGRG